MSTLPFLLVFLQTPPPPPPPGSGARQEHPVPPAQATAPSAPAEAPPLTLPPGVVATYVGKPITMEEYKEFLWIRHCKQDLRDLVAFKLLEEEAAKQGIVVTDAEVRERLDKLRSEFVSQRHQGDSAKAEKEMRETGFTFELYLRSQAFMTKKDLLQDRLALRTRVVTDDLVKQRFNQKYGVDGVKVEVRQIIITKITFQREEIQKGKKPAEVDPNAVEAKAREAAFRAHERWKKGEDFAEVARQTSHDPTAKTSGGLVPNYNYDRYGDEFARIVRSLEEKQVSDPFPSPAGWHIVQVLSRTTTRLEDVRDALVKELTGEPASWPEKNELYKRVYEGGEVVLW